MQSQGIAITTPTDIQYTPNDAPSCTISNRGLDGGGLYLVAGRSYHGYLFARAPATAKLPVSLVVGLSEQRASTRISLATTVLQVNSTSWKRLNFTLTPNSSTECVTTAASTSRTCHSNAEDLCPVCSGEFTIGVSGAAEVHVDQAYLGPGAWGMYSGLPTRVDVVERIQVC